MHVNVQYKGQNTSKDSMKSMPTTPYMSHIVRKRVFRVLTKSDTNWAVQPQKVARDLKFRI